MKVIVLIRFKDKNTKCFHEIDDELNIDVKRYEEIKQFVKIKEEPKSKNNKSSSVKGQISNK